MTAGQTSMMSDDGNQMMYHQMMHNILETINLVCSQHHFVTRISTHPISLIFIIYMDRQKSKLLKKSSSNGVKIT